MVQKWEAKTILCTTRYIKKNDRDVHASFQGHDGEYTVAFLDGQWILIEPCCNILGEQGWELTGTTPILHGGAGWNNFFLLFKRPKNGRRTVKF